MDTTTKKAGGSAFVLIALALCASVFDGGLSAMAIHRFVEVGMSEGVAAFIAVGAALMIVTFAFSLFLKGLELNDIKDAENRKRAGIVITIGFALYVAFSGFTNSMTIGVPKGQVVTTAENVALFEDWIKDHNKLVGDINTEILTFPGIATKIKNDIACELSSGCLSGGGGGHGDVTNQLQTHQAALQGARSAVQEYAQQQKGYVKNLNYIVSELRYHQEEVDHLEFQEKQLVMKGLVKDLEGVAQSMKNLWPDAAFYALSDAFEKVKTTYMAEGIPAEAARELENTYHKKALRYNELALRLDRAKRGYVPSWQQDNMFDYLFATPDLVYTMIISLLLAGATPALLLLHVLFTARSEAASKEDSNPPSGDGYNRHDHHVDGVQPKSQPRLVRTDRQNHFDEFDFTRH